MTAAITRRLVPVAALWVVAGDELGVGGRRVPVTNNVRGDNGQRYLMTETPDGAIFVHECDPLQTVSVWR